MKAQINDSVDIFVPTFEWKILIIIVQLCDARVNYKPYNLFFNIIMIIKINDHNVNIQVSLARFNYTPYNNFLYNKKKKIST